MKRAILYVGVLAVLAGCGEGEAPEGKAVTLVTDGVRAAAPAKKEHLELRLYTVDAGEKRARLDEFLGQVAVPAWNRIGIGPVGVFQWKDGNRADLYVLLPHKSIESFATARQRLLADREFTTAGARFLNLPKKDPLYRRVESSLMIAFDECPKVEAEVKVQTRIFQLRIYESHSLLKGQKKVHMFDEGGEIALFRDCGMQPVFFGETLIGTKIPNLTYMLVFENDEARKANWKKFVSSAGWNKLKRKPIYRETVSGITNIFLKATPYSQL